MRYDLKAHPFQHPTSNIFDLEFCESQNWLHFGKDELVDPLESNGQNVRLRFRLVIRSQRERRLLAISLLVPEINYRGTRLSNAIEIESRLCLENLLPSLDL